MLRSRVCLPRMSSRASSGHIALALVAVYLIWGSTYLAIRFALDTLPPFTMAGTRFVMAGLCLLAFARGSGATSADRQQWWSAALIGGLMLVGGNGAVCWAEKTVPSGLASLLVATVPLWAVAMGALLPGGQRPSPRVILGILFGLAGVGILVQPQKSGAVDPAGAAALLFASASWAAGSVLSKRVRLPASPILSTAMQMLCGGSLLLVIGAIAGEWASIHLQSITTKSALAVVYLMVFGSIIGFTAFVWLLRNTTAVIATSYAYVNPLVAVLLGWALNGETPSPRTATAGALVVSAVVLITTARPPK